MSNRKEVLKFYGWVAWDTFKQVAYCGLLTALLVAVVLVFIYFGA